MDYLHRLSQRWQKPIARHGPKKPNSPSWQTKHGRKLQRQQSKRAIRPQDRPKGCDIEPAPHVPRLVVNDGTIERRGAILAQHPRGTLQMRDELAGWLEGMQCCSGGGTGCPFLLEVFGGRGFTVER
ncbi:MAG: DUF3987 domain-containing protein [Rhodobacteraceae bacterium]|nr:DUF3987 domain-containing protein [Paracoccaceae bacterium]